MKSGTPKMGVEYVDFVPDQKASEVQHTPAKRSPVPPVSVKIETVNVANYIVLVEILVLLQGHYEGVI